MVTLRAGHDVAYFTRGSCAGGCVGAMSYYTASGEPPGQWAGQGARSLGLDGEVDPDVIQRLYQKGIGPGGEMLLRPRVPKPVQEREDAAVAAFLAGHPFASAVEIAEVRAAERAKEAVSWVPYYDQTISAAKSVSVLHASLKLAAKRPARTATRRPPTRSTAKPTGSKPTLSSRPASRSSSSRRRPATPVPDTTRPPGSGATGTG